MTGIQCQEYKWEAGDYTPAVSPLVELQQIRYIVLSVTCRTGVVPLGSQLLNKCIPHWLTDLCLLHELSFLFFPFPSGTETFQRGKLAKKQKPTVTIHGHGVAMKRLHAGKGKTEKKYTLMPAVIALGQCQHGWNGFFFFLCSREFSRFLSGNCVAIIFYKDFKIIIGLKRTIILW